jgi:hypothetical protein
LVTIVHLFLACRRLRTRSGGFRWRCACRGASRQRQPRIPEPTTRAPYVAPAPPPPRAHPASPFRLLISAARSSTPLVPLIEGGHDAYPPTMCSLLCDLMAAWPPTRVSLASHASPLGNSCAPSLLRNNANEYRLNRRRMPHGHPDAVSQGGQRKSHQSWHR